MIELELPYPPSVNHYWRSIVINRHAIVKISKEGRLYREAVSRIWAESGLKMIDGPVAMMIHLYTPDYRERDLDNVNKSLFDSLAHAGAIEGDSFVVWFISEKRHDCDKVGRVLLKIMRAPNECETRKTGAWLK